MDIDELERDADQRPLTPQEVTGLDAMVRQTPDAAARHRAVLLLARTHTTDAEHALHALLERGADPAVAVPALETLCVRWGLTERYAGMLRHFVRGVRWDTEHGGDVRRAAIAIAGEHLASHSDTELMFDL
ncbi:MAG TPA: hypothetical protein VFY79_09375, partial [Dehalococcoidia bacterium]|nr:hypothetical protein [Dehalococcoidia bacterium]